MKLNRVKSLVVITPPKIADYATADTNWITNISDNKSTSGWVFILRRGTISWTSNKQTYISHFSIEFKFIAQVVTGKETNSL